MISSLTSIHVTLPQEHCDVIEHIKEKLTVNPKLNVPTLAAHYDKLQTIAQKLGKHFEVDARLMQSDKPPVVNGIWKICPSGHVYCKPRDLTVNGSDEWQCPDCTQ